MLLSFSCLVAQIHIDGLPMLFSSLIGFRAFFLTAAIGKTVSKQAVFSRMNAAWVKTVKALLQEVVGQQTKTKTNHPLFEHFKNVWLQDSTTLRLPDILVDKFKGSVSNGKQHAIAKLNVIIHAVSGLCPVLEWSSFTVNEQSLSKSILQTAKAGDLVIRDLGYFVLPVFQQLAASKIYWSQCIAVKTPQFIAASLDLEF